jgi:hypothetical protein
MPPLVLAVIANSGTNLIFFMDDIISYHSSSLLPSSLRQAATDARGGDIGNTSSDHELFRIQIFK